jgi:DNA polymerase III subunit delta
VSVHLVTGADPLLRDDTAAALVAELLGSGDRALTVEEFTIPGRGEGDDSTAEGREGIVGNVVNAASSPPFMTERRIVIVRDIGALRAGDLPPLVAYLEAPLETTELVLVAGGGKTPDALDRQLRAQAAVSEPAATRGSDVLARELAAAGLSFTEAASESVLAHVGADAGLLPGLVSTLQAAYGDGAQLDVGDVEPYLGEAGSIPNWDLTNAIERGDVGRALATVRRLLTVTSPLQPRPLHPLQITGLLHGHYRRLLVLDDPAVRTSDDAAAAIGGRTSSRRAGFRLRQARALGSEGLRRAFDLIAQADLDVKGARAIPADVVVELLVARLAALTPGAGRQRTSSRRPSRRAS